VYSAEKQLACKEGGQGREELIYEREFIESERMFTAREILLPHGAVAITL